MLFVIICLIWGVVVPWVFPLMMNNGFVGWVIFFLLIAAIAVALILAKVLFGTSLADFFKVVLFAIVFITPIGIWFFFPKVRDKITTILYGRMSWATAKKLATLLTFIII